MHSSRMRTVRCSGRLDGGGGGLAGVVSVQRGGAVCLSRGVSVWGCVCLSGGGACPGGVSPGGGEEVVCVCLAGVSVRPGEVCIPACNGADTPTVDRQTPVKTLPFRNYCCGQ